MTDIRANRLWMVAFTKEIAAVDRIIAMAIKNRGELEARDAASYWLDNKATILRRLESVRAHWVEVDRLKARLKARK